MLTDKSTVSKGSLRNGTAATLILSEDMLEGIRRAVLIEMREHSG